MTDKPLGKPTGLDRASTRGQLTADLGLYLYPHLLTHMRTGTQQPRLFMRD